MKTILIVFLIFAALGCATYRHAVLVHQEFTPKRMGVVQVPLYKFEMQSRPARKEADKLMAEFCAPESPSIVSIDRASTVTGSTSAYVGMGITSNEVDSHSDNYVKFTCEPKLEANSADQPSH